MFNSQMPQMISATLSFVKLLPPTHPPSSPHFTEWSLDSASEGGKKQREHDSLILSASFANCGSLTYIFRPRTHTHRHKYNSLRVARSGRSHICGTFLQPDLRIHLIDTVLSPLFTAACQKMLFVFSTLVIKETWPFNRVGPTPGEFLTAPCDVTKCTTKQAREKTRCR